MEFIDLKEQFRRYRADIETRMAAVLEHGHFIMGPEIAELEKQLDLVQKELVLGMESLEAKVRELEQELKWKSARVMALELDLERAREKLMWKE